MSAIRVASGALLGLGALALSAPVILASDTGDAGRADATRGTPFGFRITPTTVAAGGRVSLHLDRGSGCRGAATVTSGVFDTVRIPSERDSVTATVDRAAKSQASYRVTFDCDGSSASTELAIASGTSAGNGDGHTDEHGDGNGRTDEQTGGRTDGRTDGPADAGTDSGTAGHTGSTRTDAHGDGDTDSRATDSRADAGTGVRADGGGSSGGELNPQPIPPGRGVQAGEGGSIDGFDLKEIGLGAALVVGSVGTAYRLSRRHTGEDGA